MFELHTFGPVGLRSRDVGDSTALLVQPKRLALLIYLALAPRRRYRRRDQVIALFWPELDAEHARGSLSQALRYLRRSLDEAVLISQGEEEIGVDGRMLWCDATEFSRACAVQECERALELYKGPFLEEFFGGDASPGYQVWVDAERARLRDQASLAALWLSQRAERENDLPGALRWARRAAELAPEDEAVVAWLIGLQDRNGDRAGALRTYEALRQRLRDEFQVAPCHETRALVARILQR